MLTIVTLNYRRPRSMLENLRTYAGYRLVDRIICFNNGAPLDPKSVPGKCVLVQASENMGLYPRFSMGALSRTQAILHTDDDILVPESTLQALYFCWQSAQDSCHGLHGRIARPTYQLGNILGNVEVVLTRAVLCSRRVNNAALSATIYFDDLRGQPSGNGEDIILSFTSMATSGRLNCAYALPARDHKVDPATAIHSWDGHVKHRQAVVSRCRKVFSLP
jgi:hypothetical protein